MKERLLFFYLKTKTCFCNNYISYALLILIVGNNIRSLTKFNVAIIFCKSIYGVRYFNPKKKRLIITV